MTTVATAGTSQTTITEALASLVTLGKRLTKKREFVGTYLHRADGIKDPLERSVEGGSAEAIKRELQAIRDLEKHHLNIRMAIQRKNQETYVTVLDLTMTVAEWLTWRKEIAPQVQKFNHELRLKLVEARTEAQRRGAQVIGVGAAGNTDTKPTDIVVNVDEKSLQDEAERIEEVLGTLDGKLSLINATTT